MKYKKNLCKQGKYLLLILIVYNGPIANQNDISLHNNLSNGIFYRIITTDLCSNILIFLNVKSPLKMQKVKCI